MQNEAEGKRARTSWRWFVLPPLIILVLLVLLIVFGGGTKLPLFYDLFE